MRALAPTDLFRVDREWALALAVCAIANFHFLRGILIEWTQDGIALSAVELDVLELGEYARPPGHDASHADKIVQVARAKLAQRGTQRQVGDANVHFRVNTLVTWVINENCGESDLVKDGEHDSRRIGKKVGKDGLG